ncbi:hypothetical protein ACEPAF_1139 [Sanghuangporus sanghuang]
MKGAVFNAHGELMHNDGTIFDGSQSTRSFAIDEDMEKDAAIVDSVDFALTGRIPNTGDNEACQASVSLTDYHLLNGDGLRTLRDYDSVIGMSKDLPYTTSMKMRVWPDVTKGLQNNVHVFYENTEGKKFKLHHIPNLDFGSVGGNIAIRLFFPELYTPVTANFVPAPMRIAPILYDTCIRTVLEQVMPDRMGHLPTNYTAEMTRTQTKSGTHVRSSYDIPEDSLQMFCDLFFDKLSEYDWGRNAFFGHEIRGAKNSNFHEIHIYTAEAALTRLSEHLSADDIVESIALGNAKWYIDVGFEVTYPAHTLLPMRLMHPHILAWMLGISEDDARVHLRTSSRTNIHEIAHLKKACGFDVSFGFNGAGPMECMYAVAYGVEKTPTALIERGHNAKYVKCSELVKLRQERKTSFPLLVNLFNSFNSCAATDISYAVRFEVRVPLAHALTPFTTRPPALSSFIYAIPNRIYWGFKAERVRAIKTCIQWILSCPRDTVFYDIPSLALVAGLTYMANALCNRPEEGSAWTMLRDGLLPHAKVPRDAFSETHQQLHRLNRGLERGDRVQFVEGPDGEMVEYDEAEEDIGDSHLVSVDNTGAFFIKGITFGDNNLSPTLTNGYRVHRNCLETLFQTKSLSLLYMDATQGGDRSVVRIRAAPDGYNRQGPTEPVEINPDSLSQFEPINGLFQLDQRHITIGTFDFTGEAIRTYGMQNASRLSSNDKAKVIIMQFIHDFFAMGVKPRTETLSRTEGEGYFKISLEQQEDATINFFLREDVRTIFHFFGTAKDNLQGVRQGRGPWDQSKKYFFPDFTPIPVKEGKKRQGWGGLRYLQWYHAIKETTRNQNDFLAFRNQILKVIDQKFTWLPLAQKERPFDTRQTTRQGVYPASRINGPAIVLVFNPQYKSRMDYTNEVYFPRKGTVLGNVNSNALVKRTRYEEEEDEDEDDQRYQPRARY